jgi:hypothetical protein
MPEEWFSKGVVSKALLCARARNKEKSLIEMSSPPYAQVLVSCLGVRGLESRCLALVEGSLAGSVYTLCILLSIAVCMPSSRRRAIVVEIERREKRRRDSQDERSSWNRLVVAVRC